MDGRRLVRDCTAKEMLSVAKALKRERDTLAKFALTVLVEDDQKITHIICRRESAVRR